MIKVLIIGYSNVFGGIERFILSLLDHMDRQKWSFDLLIYKKLSDEQEKLIESKNVNIYYVSQLGKAPLVFLREIFSFYKKHSYDIIHINSSHAISMLYTIPVWWNKEIKIVYHSHNMDGNAKILHQICKRIVKIRSDIKLACSTPAACYMYDSSKDVEIIKNGIDISRFIFDSDIREAIRNRLGIDKTNMVIGNIGRFVQEKNHKFLIDIFRELLKIDNNVSLVLLGDGPLKGEIEDYAGSRNIINRIIFTGNVTNVQDWYQAFDAFVLPSLYEGFPFVVVEAQANDLPVFLSDTISSETKITDKVSFLNINKGTKYWADEIYVNMQTNLNLRVRQNVSWDMKQAGYDFTDTVSRMEDIYLKLKY